MKFQLVLFAFALVLVFASYADAQHVKICEPKSVFMDDCNTYRCSDDGYDKTCTRIMCVKKIGGEAGNTKIGTGDTPRSGFIAIISDICGRDEPRISIFTYAEDNSCVPGSKFKVSCHDCICTESGSKASALCTLEACMDELQGQTKRYARGSRYCTPGSMFKIDCNECICSGSGMCERAACTLKACF